AGRGPGLPTGSRCRTARRIDAVVAVDAHSSHATTALCGTRPALHSVPAADLALRSGGTHGGFTSGVTDVAADRRADAMNAAVLTLVSACATVGRAGLGRNSPMKIRHQWSRNVTWLVVPAL